MSINLITYDKDMPMPTGWYLIRAVYQEQKQWATVHYDKLFNMFDIAPFEDDFTILEIALLPER